MEIIPIISVYKGRLAKTQQGDFDRIRQYDIFPLEVAQQFEAHGIRRINLVDLEGARKGSIANYETLELIARHTSLEIDFSGGITSDGSIRLAFENGASFVTSGSVAVNDRDLFTSWIITYGRDKIILAADSKEGKISIGGWARHTDTNLIDHIDYYFSRAIRYVKCTDISFDGLMNGPSLEFYKKVVSKFPELDILASGGVQSIDDFKRLEEVGVSGVLFATAFYEGKITLKELERFNSRAVA